MKKRLTLSLLLCAALLLSGCGQTAQVNETQKPEATSTGAPATLSDAVSALLAPYESLRSKTEAGTECAFACSLPKEAFSQFAQDAAQNDHSPQDGRYRFTADSDSIHLYEANGMEVASDPDTTPDPADDAPMDESRMGDYAVSGGGHFVRSRAYNIATSMTDGEMEFTDKLNGERSGHELFRFASSDGTFWFIDAALIPAWPDYVELSDNVTPAPAAVSYFVTVGKFTENRLEIAEYELPDISGLPSPGQSAWNSLPTGAVRYTVE